MWVRREEMGVYCGMMKWVGQWSKREQLLRGVCREEMGLLVTDTDHREWLLNRQLKLQKDWWTDDGESDCGMFSRVTKRCFGKS